VDGNLVTSRWPPDLPAFMRELMKLIGSVKKLEKSIVKSEQRQPRQ